MPTVEMKSMILEHRVREFIKEEAGVVKWCEFDIVTRYMIVRSFHFVIHSLGGKMVPMWEEFLPS